MSLFDQAKNLFAGATGEPSHATGLEGAALGLLTNYPGGLNGLLESFQKNGLGGVVSSWVGHGENLPISGDQVKSVLGNEQVAAIASKFGLSADDVSSHLSQILPTVVDKLTPGGAVPAGENPLLAQGLGLLQGFLKKEA